jgi:hypothetical protein
MPSHAAIRQAIPEWPEWMDLKTLERYSSISIRTLRSWIKAPDSPLPASTRGGKILVSRRAFDAWMNGHAIKVSSVDVGQIVNEILESL